MRGFRLVIAVMLAASLAILPASAAMAVSHAAKAEMSMTAAGSDCPCCDAAHKCSPDTCMISCHGVSAISAVGPDLIQPLPELFVDMGPADLSPFSARPDPPPPRS